MTLPAKGPPRPRRNYLTITPAGLDYSLRGSVSWGKAAKVLASVGGPVAAAYQAIASRPGPAVVVSDEVGLGIVPMHANARVYRDLVGIAHQRLAAIADEAYLFVAGLPVTLKGP